ncbi:hypothetical protein SAMN05444360_1418 [Chryseobacterium carnipullorum]|uniref:hypothetical protein n=1 Tax=Chryseobacterium carnipullorum TaxID=1124835 RepID=UPI00091A4188|nr:hypothetical protein [Chryseobacterium carnipullorum]SHN07970.1 hypothetical protein SAMN05444360_1418 [Chryseobacterium carnipullorum]
MIEKLKYALFSISDYDIYRKYFQTKDSITIYYKNVIVKATNDEISVFYDSEEHFVTKGLKYLDKNNTLKLFTDIPAAIDYMSYLSLVTLDIRYTLYHYFLFKSNESEIDYKSISFVLVGSYPNYSEENLSIRCDIGGLTIKNRKVKYNCLILFNNDGSCRFSFYPEEPAWNEEKICPKRDIDKIIEYILNLNVDNYEDIPLIES